MGKTLNELMKQVDEFADTRHAQDPSNWKNDDPNQLITSILIELGELSEHYQWSSKFKDYEDSKKKEIAFEVVDVLIYLLRLASKSKIDLDASFQEKFAKLAIKFPLNSDYFAQKELYRKTGKNKLYE